MVGSYFLDRDPNYFRPVLNFLRSNQLQIDTGISCGAVLEEAIYFNVLPMQIALYEAYQQNRIDMTSFSPVQLEKLFSLTNNVREAQGAAGDRILDALVEPAAAVASSKSYQEPTRIRSEITRKELIQIIANADTTSKLRLSGICLSYQGRRGIVRD